MSLHFPLHTASHSVSPSLYVSVFLFSRLCPLCHHFFHFLRFLSGPQTYITLNSFRQHAISSLAHSTHSSLSSQIFLRKCFLYFFCGQPVCCLSFESLLSCNRPLWLIIPFPSLVFLQSSLTLFAHSTLSDSRVWTDVKNTSQAGNIKYCCTS